MSIFEVIAREKLYIEILAFFYLNCFMWKLKKYVYIYIFVGSFLSNDMKKKKIF